MAIGNQGIFDAVLGYSLKRDYHGDSMNWRNTETFNLEVIVTDTGNLNTLNNKNFLSQYLLTQVADKLKVDKRNTTIKSVELPSGGESIAGNQILGGKYIVTAEVKTKIDDATLLAQHPELNESTGAESGKFYGVKDAIHQYADEIVSITEDYTFGNKENGDKDFTHTVNLTLRRPDHCSECEDGAWATCSECNDGEWENDPLNFPTYEDCRGYYNLQNSANCFSSEAECRTYYNCSEDKNDVATKTLAQTIAGTLFSHDYLNTYFGHNAFTGALQNYGGGANKHYFTENYDQFKNVYSFSKKMTILHDSSSNYTASKRYTIDFSKDGRVVVNETIELKSRTGNFSQIKTDMVGWKSAAYTRCNAILGNYNAPIDGQQANAASALLSQVPISQTIIYNKQGLAATLSSQFTSDIQISALGLILGKGAQFLETIDLSRDHRGVVTANYNVTLTSHASKSTSHDSDPWTIGTCATDGQCRAQGANASTYMSAAKTFSDQTNCEANGYCTDPSATNPTDCAATASGTWNYHIWADWDTETLCEGAGNCSGDSAYDNDETACLQAGGGSCSDPTQQTKAQCDAVNANWTWNNTFTSSGGGWTMPKSPIDILRDYDTASFSKINAALAYSYPNASDSGVKGVFWNTIDWWNSIGRIGATNVIGQGGFPSVTVNAAVKSINTQVSAQSSGKTFTLTKTFSNDATYFVSDGADGVDNPLEEFCPGCFNKMDIKWNDVFPKRTVNEHIIIDRESLEGEIAKMGTSVLSDVYFTQPGKRTVTLNGVLKRPYTSQMTNPQIPANALKAMAKQAKYVMYQVFTHPKVRNTWQFAFYLSNLSYNYDSDNNVSMTAELTYTYKKPKPN